MTQFHAQFSKQIQLKQNRLIKLNLMYLLFNFNPSFIIF